jgi:hypothetical protein
MSINSNTAWGNQGNPFAHNCSSIQISPKLTGEVLEEKKYTTTLYFIRSQGFSKNYGAHKRGCRD